MSLRIEVIETAENHYAVIIGDRYAANLTIDEALGVVASALFTGNPLYVRTYEQQKAMNDRLNVSTPTIADLTGQRPTA